MGAAVDDWVYARAPVVRRGPYSGWLWRDPRPPAPWRILSVALPSCSLVLAGAALVAGITGRSSQAAVAVTAAAPAVVMGPACTTLTAVVPAAGGTAPGHVDAFAVDGRGALAYLPPPGAAAPGTRLPVVYFLHGSPGDARDWLGSGAQLPSALDRMRALGQLPPLIAVFPDGNGADGAWWGNTVRGAALETWFVDRLVPAVDRRYVTLGAAQRGIAGVSAGGFGAVNLAVHHPGLFSWVASYSGVFTAPPAVFGRDSATNSPALTVAGPRAVQRFALYVGAGSDDQTFRPESERFVGIVRGLSWAPLATEIVSGPHGWEAWAAEARNSLAWLGRLWSADPAISSVAGHRACP